MNVQRTLGGIARYPSNLDRSRMFPPLRHKGPANRPSKIARTVYVLITRRYADMVTASGSDFRPEWLRDGWCALEWTERGRVGHRPGATGRYSLAAGEHHRSAGHGRSRQAARHHKPSGLPLSHDDRWPMPARRDPPPFRWSLVVMRRILTTPPENGLDTSAAGAPAVCLAKRQTRPLRPAGVRAAPERGHRSRTGRAQRAAPALPGPER